MRNWIIIVLFLLVISSGVLAVEAGTGFSMFFPESYYNGDGGSISVENGLSTSIGLGGIISMPIGFSYNKIQGYMVEGATVDGNAVESTKPWFMGDSFMGYLMLKATLPLGSLFFEVFGGGGANWNASLTAFKGNIAEDLAPENEYAVLNDDFARDNNLGYGWLAGAGVGVTISSISISVDFLYRDLQADLDMSGTYNYGPAGEVTGTKTLDGSDAKLVMRGVSLGLGGSFAF